LWTVPSDPLFVERREREKTYSPYENRKRCGALVTGVGTALSFFLWGGGRGGKREGKSVGSVQLKLRECVC